MNWIYSNTTLVMDTIWLEATRILYTTATSRYSALDNCNYQLIDKYTHQVQRSFWGMTCKQGYDACSTARYDMNYRTSSFRYSCVETFRDRSYNFNVNTYDYNTYDDYNGRRLSL